MADFTITAAQNGAYEIALTANTKVTVDVTGKPGTPIIAQVLAHTGTAPVYARVGTAITVKDPAARIVPVGTWLDLNGGDWNQTGVQSVSLISAAAATVSVTRP